MGDPDPAPRRSAPILAVLLSACVFHNNGPSAFTVTQSGANTAVRDDPAALVNEISRAPLIAADHPSINRRRLGFVVQWSHPAYASRHVIARNNGEIVRFSLAKE